MKELKKIIKEVRDACQEVNKNAPFGFGFIPSHDKVLECATRIYINQLNKEQLDLYEN